MDATVAYCYLVAEIIPATRSSGIIAIQLWDKYGIT